jgi:hypothetical protein
MAKLRDLVSRISDVTGVAVATVREISRRLREADLIHTGEGGRYGGADMMPSDAASLLTALLIVRASSVSQTDIVPLTKTYLRSLKSHGPRGHRMVLDRWDRKLALPELCRLNSGHTFEDALIALIVSFSNRDFERNMAKMDSVSLLVKVFTIGPDPTAAIEFDTGKLGLLNLFYIRRRVARATEATAPRRWSDIPEGANSDLFVEARVGEATLKSVGLLLRDSGAKHVGARVSATRDEGGSQG